MKDKNQKSESRTSLAISNQNETTNNQSTDFVDNSPEAQEAKRLQEMADNSQESLALQQWQNNIEPPPEENTTGLPDDLKNNLESMSGMSLDQVKVHYNSPKPAKLEAHAYAEFPNIYIALGQEKYLPEEAAHMIQQMQGRVKATEKVNGTPINDNPSLEKEAIKEGQKASGGVQKKQEKNLVQKKGQGVVQRAKIEKKSHYGTFSVDEAKYKFINDNKKLAANITFEPGDNTDATKIGLTQVIKNEKEGKQIFIDPNAKTKMTKDGYRIDRLSDKNNPIYGSKSLGEEKGLEDTKQDNNWEKPDPVNLEPGNDRNATYELGHHYKEKEEDVDFKSKNAGLYDGPRTKGGKNSMREFETSALGLEGKQKGEYYGSVKWGWERDSTGALTKIAFDLVSKGTPSKNFMEAAQKWNDATARGTQLVKSNETAVTSKTLVELFKLQEGDEVIQKKTMGSGKRNFLWVEVKSSKDDASLIGKEGLIDVTKLKDKGDGKKTINLPIVKTKVPTEADVPLYKDKEKGKEDKKLDKRTRMKVLKEEGNMIEVEIVDGDDITKTGWVEKTKIKDE